MKLIFTILPIIIHTAISNSLIEDIGKRIFSYLTVKNENVVKSPSKNIINVPDNSTETKLIYTIEKLLNTSTKRNEKQELGRNGGDSQISSIEISIEMPVPESGSKEKKAIQRARNNNNNKSNKKLRGIMKDLSHLSDISDMTSNVLYLLQNDDGIDKTSNNEKRHKVNKKYPSKKERTHKSETSEYKNKRKDEYSNSKLRDHIISVIDFYHKIEKLNTKNREQKSKNFSDFYVRTDNLERPSINDMYEKDDLLNFMATGHYRRNGESDESSTSSSSEEDTWRERYKQKMASQYQQTPQNTKTEGDTVNMVMARPWGVKCGDPFQHDVPWGSCMLPPECEPELRIYRGDHFCGNTEFVCCALMVSSYNTNQPFDLSLASDSFDTDTEEKEKKRLTSKERRRRRKNKEKRRRETRRKRRKKEIQKLIKKTVKQLKKVLDKMRSNSTKVKQKKTKMLKKFIKQMKEKYKKDRESVKLLNEEKMIKIDLELRKRLEEIIKMNRNFVNNAGLRDILLNGTMTRTQANTLLHAYPQLADVIKSRRFLLGIPSRHRRISNKFLF